MSDYAGEPVTIKITDPRDENGVPLDNSNAAVEVSIFHVADLTTPVVDHDNVPWVSAVSQFRYLWDTTGLAPGEYLAQVWVTPTGALPSFEWERIELAASPTGPSCHGPWVDAGIACLQGLEDPGDGVLIAQAASELLYNATARQFTGVCIDVVRPPSANVVGGFLPGTRLADGSLWLGEDGLSTLPESTFSPLGMMDGTTVRSSLLAHSSVRLPGWPIGDRSLVKVTIDGTLLDPSEWLIVDDRDIVRAHGKSWPLWQRLDRPAGEPGTWTIEYPWGVPVPSSGVLAAKTLACEFALSWKQDKACRLPKRLQSINRENLQAVVLDPFTFLDKGGFGIYEIDTFVNSWNPNHLTRDAKVLNVDLLAAQPRRIR